MHDRITGKRLDGSGGKGRRGTASQRYGATDEPCQDHPGGWYDNGVQPYSTNVRSCQQYFHDKGDGQQPSAAHGRIGGDYAISGGGLRGGRHHEDFRANFPLSFTPSPTAITVAHHHVADMPPVTYQHQQQPRAMVVQQQQRHHHHVGVEGPMGGAGGAGGVFFHYGTDDQHVPPGSSEQSRNAMGSMSGARPLPYAPTQDGAAMHGASFGLPPPHAGPTLQHQNVTPTRKTNFSAWEAPRGGKQWAGGKAQYFHR